MSKTIVRPTLSLGNHIYLYRLLRDAIGCGKQTFMTQVEEALAVGDMTPYDLGFESTRELLEELDGCIKLTVFKGGRCMPRSSPTRHGMPHLPRARTSPRLPREPSSPIKRKSAARRTSRLYAPSTLSVPNQKPRLKLCRSPSPRQRSKSLLRWQQKPKPKSPP